MAFNISEFQGAMNLDGARPNLFEVVISALDRKFSFMCKSAQLPGSTVTPIEIPYFGRYVKLAGNRVFPEWTVQVINDEDFLIRNQLEEWMADLNTHETNVARSFYQGYAYDATVNQYGKQGDIIKTYNFVGLFPTDLSPIDLDWGANDTIEEFTVTFAYQYWNTPTANVE